MKSTHPFHGNDPAFFDHPGETGQYLIEMVDMLIPGDVFILWTAMIAGYRLCMKAPVVHIGIFCAAYFTHRKRLHGRFIPVVRQIPDDGEPRAAIGTVDERITDPVRLRSQILKTILAHGNIGADFRHPFRVVAAFSDLK